MSTAKRRRARSTAVGRRRRKTKAILVIQFDSARLEREGLDLTPFADAAALVADVVHVRATTLGDLHRQLAEHHGRTFDVVATIGHSNANRIRIASDHSVSWDAYAQYLKPFEPRRLAIVGCLAGQFPSTASVFAALRTVRRIYAPPALANRQLASVMVLALPYLVEHTIPDRQLLRLVQGGLVLTGRQLWEWRRTDWERNRSNILAPIAHNIFHRLSGELVEWLSGRRRA